MVGFPIILGAVPNRKFNYIYTSMDLWSPSTLINGISSQRFTWMWIPQTVYLHFYLNQIFMASRFGWFKDRDSLMPTFSSSLDIIYFLVHLCSSQYMTMFYTSNNHLFTWDTRPTLVALRGLLRSTWYCTHQSLVGIDIYFGEIEYQNNFIEIFSEKLVPKV